MIILPETSAASNLICEPDFHRTIGRERRERERRTRSLPLPVLTFWLRAKDALNSRRPVNPDVGFLLNA